MERYYRLGVFACLLTGGCTSLDNGPPPAHVGQALVFDGRRLSQELAERRLDIENAIDAAAITDIETSASIFRGRSSQLGLDVKGTTINSEIDTLIAQDEQQTVAADTLTARFNAEKTELEERAERQAIATDQYNALVEYHTTVLATPGNEPEDIARRDASAQTLQTLLSIEPLSNSASQNASVEANTKTDAEVLQAAKDLATNATEQLKVLTAQPPSPRRNTFQQYQAYLDELYNTRNRFFISDTHRDKHRMVRLVFPVYVPPSVSDEPTHIEMRLTPKSGDEGDSEHLRLTSASALVNVLNDRAMQGELAPYNVQTELDLMVQSYLSRTCECKASDTKKIDGVTKCKTNSARESITRESASDLWRHLRAAKRAGFNTVTDLCLEPSSLPPTALSIDPLN